MESQLLNKIATTREKIVLSIIIYNSMISQNVQLNRGIRYK